MAENRLCAALAAIPAVSGRTETPMIGITPHRQPLAAIKMTPASTGGGC